MNGRICGFCIISFNFSINQFLEYCDLTKVIAARLLTNFTFVLQRISKRKFVTIFCYTEVLFSRHSESNRTHTFLKQAVQSLQKISFYVVGFVCFVCFQQHYSAASVVQTKQHSLKPTKKKIMALFVQYHYKRVYCKRTV